MRLPRKWSRIRCIFLIIIFVFYSVAILLGMQVMHLKSSQFNDLVDYLSEHSRNKAHKFTSGNDSISDSVKKNSNLTLEYIDWNDYDFMAKESQRQGWGEQGAAFNKTLSAEEQNISQKLMSINRYNVFASDHISLERSIGDTRTADCKKQKFLKNLPENSISIIIIFHNERNVTILRTLHSITNRSPARLLKEIVIVDDVSNNEELKDPLENYIYLHFPKAKVVRNKQRQGLIRSRIVGANASSGDILVFFDSHVEVNHNYLPPLIEPIVLDYRTIVCPMIDTIRSEDLKIAQTRNRERGTFDWSFIYQRLPVFPKDETSPHPAPAMVGAAFAISRKWWEEIKMYDPGLEIWGGEQYEISFKSWQCGGRVVDAPCSKVAHLFRPLPYVEDVIKDNLFRRNYLRVAKVWMDEYIDYVYLRIPDMRKIDPGDLTEQIALRKKLNCKSFKWYMTEVAPDMVKYFPLIDPPNKAWGKLKSRYNNSLCILTENSYFVLRKCDASPNAYYWYNWKLNIHYGNKCFTNGGDISVFMSTCFVYEEKLTQRFVWDQHSGRIVNLYTRLCIDVDVSTMKVYTVKCDSSKVTQSWTFEYFNSTLVQEAWEKHRV